jgi:serine/threonine-protein kinase ULK/ATG1
MAPEILRYEKYDAKADLWSVGAVLYEMAVGKPPFRAQNHMELLKKIEASKGVKFPDEDPQSHHSHSSRNNTGADTPASADIAQVPSDVKKLIRSLLKRNPAERCSFDDFFGSTALAKSKFPRPSQQPRDPSPPPSPIAPPSPAAGDEDPADGAQKANLRPWPGHVPIPETHRVIPPEVLDPTAMIPPSKFNFRRRERETGPGRDALGLLGVVENNSRPPERHRCVLSLVETLNVDAECMLYNSSPTSSRDRDPNAPAPEDPTKRASRSSPLRPPKPLSTEGSIIPGETEEDGILRREYVLVGDTRAVEFNRAVDGEPLLLHPPANPLHLPSCPEISAARRLPLKDHRISYTSQLPATDDQTQADTATTSPTVPVPAHITFPPPPHPHAPPVAASPSSAASRVASSALNRALSLASKKLFGAAGLSNARAVVSSSPAPTGTAAGGISYAGAAANMVAGAGASASTPPPGSPRRRTQIIAGPEAEGEAERDPVEDALLAGLEELAQKTEVLTNWADEMYEYVKAVPQSACLSCQVTVELLIFLCVIVARAAAGPAKVRKT